MTAPIIDVRNLSFSYGGPRKAVDSVTFSVNSGTVYGLVGPNGSGKTTLTRILCGLQKPTGGSATVMGHDCKTEPTAIRHLVGYMSQRFSLYMDLSVAENIEFFSRMHGVTGPAGKARIDEVIALTKLEPHLKKPCMMLSGGWKQRVALATTILHKPPLMFLDEPTAGVDPVARRELWDLLFDLAASGSDIFVTTQYMDEIERCGEVGYIYLSKMIVTGTPQHLKTNPLVAAEGTRYIELECAESIKAAPWIRARPYCKDATIFGVATHALVSNDAPDARILTDARAAGFTRVMVRTIEPSLEDVFVALTRHAAAAAPAGPVRV
jgi:ABC-type multidrug transport system ATPase subunit